MCGADLHNCPQHGHRLSSKSLSPSNMLSSASIVLTMFMSIQLSFLQPLEWWPSHDLADGCGSLSKGIVPSHSSNQFNRKLQRINGFAFLWFSFDFLSELRSFANLPLPLKGGAKWPSSAAEERPWRRPSAWSPAPPRSRSPPRWPPASPRSAPRSAPPRSPRPPRLLPLVWVRIENTSKHQEKSVYSTIESMDRLWSTNFNFHHILQSSTFIRVSCKVASATTATPMPSVAARAASGGRPDKEFEPGSNAFVREKSMNHFIEVF